MKTYEVTLVTGLKFKVENVADTFETERGMYFSGENKEELAFITFNNFSHYQLVNEKPVTNSVKTIVDGTEVTFDGNTIHLIADKIGLGGGVTLVNTEKSFTVGDLLDGLKQGKIGL